jgi:hypothetical protein
MHWRSLPRNVRGWFRAKRTARMIARRGTDIARWSDDNSYDPEWRQRSSQIAAHIKPKSSVLDIGCGLMSLREFLPQDCRYQPVDIVARAPETIICNFNQRELPPRELYDVVVCAGLLEYIHEVEWFIENFSGLWPTLSCELHAPTRPIGRNVSTGEGLGQQPLSSRSRTDVRPGRRKIDPTTEH